MQRFTKPATLAAGAAVCLVAGAGLPATAVTRDAGVHATEASKTASIRTHRGAAYFYDFGDVLHAGDYLKDGYGIRAYLVWNGHKASASAVGGDKNLSISEGTTVYLQLCYTRNGKNVKCSALKKGVA